MGIIGTAGIVGWWLGSPLFLPGATENEQRVSDLIQNIQQPVTNTTETSSSLTETETISNEKTIDSSTITETVSKGETINSSTAAETSSASTTTTTTTITPQPVTKNTIIKLGMFVQLDGQHHGTGTGAIVQLAEGGYSIFFLQVTIANGPGLFVYL